MMSTEIKNSRNHANCHRRFSWRRIWQWGSLTTDGPSGNVCGESGAREGMLGFTKNDLEGTLLFQWHFRADNFVGGRNWVSKNL